MRVTWREMRPGETMFGRGKGILVPFKKPSAKTSDANSKPQSRNPPDQPSDSEKAPKT